MQMIRHADMSDLDALAALESECFPPAEAASRDAIADRLRTYADHFWLLFDDDRLTAAINGMVTDEPDLVDAMYADTSMHDERGAWQMLFSVCTNPGSRRERRASRLMRSVIEDARDAGRDGLVLTCKEPLIGFYERFGYRDEGVCGSRHGGATVLKQCDDVVDMLRFVGLEREEPLEVLDGHARVLETADRPHAVDMTLEVYALPGRRPANVGEQPRILVIPQRRRLHMEHVGDLADCASFHARHRSREDDTPDALALKPT